MGNYEIRSDNSEILKNNNYEIKSNWIKVKQWNKKNLIKYVKMLQGG